MNIDFEFINETNEHVEEYEEVFKTIINGAFQLLKIEDDVCLSCIIVDENKIQEINRDYRKIDRVTDVITFAYEDDEVFELEGEPRELGDVFICIQRAKDQAVEYGHSFHREFCFLFTHGLLHLLGYDHMNQEDEKEMFGLQDEILTLLNINR